MQPAARALQRGPGDLGMRLFGDVEQDLPGHATSARAPSTGTMSRHLVRYFSRIRRSERLWSLSVQPFGYASSKVQGRPGPGPRLDMNTTADPGTSDLETAQDGNRTTQHLARALVDRLRLVRRPLECQPTPFTVLGLEPEHPDLDVMDAVLRIDLEPPRTSQAGQVVLAQRDVLDAIFGLQQMLDEQTPPPRGAPRRLRVRSRRSSHRSGST